MIQSASQVVDGVVHEIGVKTLELVLALSAKQVAGPRTAGKAGGEIRHYGSQRGCVQLADRKVRVKRAAVDAARTLQEASVDLWGIYKVFRLVYRFVEMRPEHWITLVGTALTATLTAFGLYFGPKIAVRRSLEQFRSQKWWERKASAYDEFIRAASRLLAYHSDCWEQQTRGWRWTEERQKEADERHKEALAVLETFSDLGGFVISEAAGKVVKRLQASEESNGNENQVEYHDRASGALIKELVDLKECAVLDLNLTTEPRLVSNGKS